jgi:hypothetical protein
MSPPGMKVFQNLKNSELNNNYVIYQTKKDSNTNGQTVIVITITVLSSFRLNTNLLIWLTNEVKF